MRTKRLIVFILIFIVISVTIYLIINNFGKTGIASLQVNSNSPMKVYIDHKEVGETPYEGTFTPRDTTIQIGNYETRFFLQPGIKTIVDRNFSADGLTSSGEVFSFQKTGLKNSSISVVSNPSGANVTIDGNLSEFTPMSWDGVTPGSHQLDIHADGYDPKTFSINTYEGYKLIAAIDMLLSPSASKPTETPEEKIFVKILSTPNGFLRVRKEPTTTADEVARVKTGEKFSLIKIDPKSGWYDIMLDATSSGWIIDTYAATSSSNIKD